MTISRQSEKRQGVFPAVVLAFSLNMAVSAPSPELSRQMLTTSPYTGAITLVTGEPTYFDIAVQGKSAVRVYRYSRASGSVGLVRELSTYEAPSALSQFTHYFGQSIVKIMVVAPPAQPSPPPSPPGGHDTWTVPNQELKAAITKLKLLSANVPAELPVGQLPVTIIPHL